MIKKFFLFLILFLLFFFLPRERYQELDQIKLIESIEVTCDYNVIVQLREIIPIRENGSITYHYQIYTYEASSFYEILPDIEKNSFYYLGVHDFQTNCSNSLDIKKYFHLNN